MLRRRPALGVLILVGLALCLSLSAALARSAQPALLTATPSPLPELAAYLPLIMRAGQPAATATAPTATASATASATATTGTLTPSTTATATTSTITPSTTATATTSTITPSTTGTATTTTTGTATATTTGTATTTTTSTIATETATATGTATTTATGTTTETATATTTETATATQTATATATGTATATATATATIAPGGENCMSNVFPIAVNRMALEENRPYWYKPVPLNNPFIHSYEIHPALNTTRADAPRFRVYTTYNNGGQFFWTRWNGNQPEGSTADLNAALSGAGTLDLGFSELPPPQSDPAAIPLVNGKLEAGDWLASTSATLNTTAGRDALDSHIVNNTLMVLPVYDQIYGGSGSANLGYHIVRLVQVRLLNYYLAGANPYLEFALVEDTKHCFGTLKLDEKLEWYELDPASNYDLVIVQDYSYSMRYCWDTVKECATGTRRIDYAADNLRRFVNHVLVIRNQQRGADHRLAYVTFGQQATQRIDFTSDTNAALAQFKTVIGDLSTPRTIPNTELSGNTNIAGGLTGAVSYLNNARTVDKNGKPVKLVVVLLTDGIANVFNDGPAAGATNRFDIAPYYCGENAADVENPLVQYNCPNPADYPGQAVSQPPLKAMVKVANDARVGKNIEFYALTLGAQNGLTPTDMHLHEVAPLFHPMAANPTQLQEFTYMLVDELTSPSCRIVSSTRTAAGAKVRIINSEEMIVSQGYVGASGIFGPNLPTNSGPYTVDANHQVVAPQDPNRYPRVYYATLTIPVIGPAQPLYNVLLTTAQNQCP